MDNTGFVNIKELDKTIGKNEVIGQQTQKYNVSESFKNDQAYEKRALEIKNTFVDKLNGQSISREEQTYYGKLLRDEAYSYEELERPVDEVFNTAKIDQDNKKERKALQKKQAIAKAKYDEYTRLRHMYGEGITMRTVDMLSDREQFKQEERKKFDKVYDKLKLKDQLHYLLQHFPLSDFSADMFEYKPGFIKRILRCLDKFDKLDVIRYKMNSDEELQKYFEELSPDYKRRFTHLVALESAYKKAAYNTLGQYGLNWKGKVDVELANKESAVRNRRLSEFNKRIDQQAATGEVQQSLEDFNGLLGSLQAQYVADTQKYLHNPDGSQGLDLLQVSQKQLSILAENKAQNDAVKAKYIDAIENHTHRTIEEKEGLLSMRDELISLMQEEEQAVARMQALQEQKARFVEIYNNNLGVDEAASDQQDSIIDKIQAFNALIDYTGNSPERYMRNKRIARLQRMVLGVCMDRPLTMSMRQELAEKYDFSGYAVNIETKIDEKEAKYSFDKTDDLKQAAFKYKGKYKIDKALEKEVDNLENIIGERTIEEFIQDKGEKYVKRHAKAIYYMQSQKYQERKRRQRELVKYLNEHFIELKDCLSLEEDSEAARKERSIKLREKQRALRKLGYEELSTDLQFAKDLHSNMIFYLSMANMTFVTGMSLSMQGSTAAGQMISKTRLRCVGVLNVLNDIYYSVDSVVAVAANSKYAADAKKAAGKLKERIEAFKKGDGKVSEEELKALEGLRRLTTIMQHGVRMGSVQAVESAANAVFSINYAVADVFGIIGATMAMVPYFAVLAGSQAVAIGTEAKKSQLRGRYVRERFAAMYEDLHSMEGDKDFLKLSARDKKHLMLKFLGAKTGKYSEAAILTAKSDADYILDQKEGADNIEAKNEVIDAMGIEKNAFIRKLKGLDEKVSASEIMSKIGVSDFASKNPHAQVSTLRRLAARKQEVAKQGKFRRSMYWVTKHFFAGNDPFANAYKAAFTSGGNHFFNDLVHTVF